MQKSDDPRQKQEPARIPADRFWPPDDWEDRPLPPYEPEDWSGFEVTDVFEQIKDPPEGCPRFKIRHTPRPDWQTEEQYQVSRRHDEELAWTFSIYLGLSQDAATHLGYHRVCREKACRRAKRCVSRRAEDDWRVFPGPMMPPCCVRERTEPVRELIRALGAHWEANSSGDEFDGPPLRARPEAPAKGSGNRRRR